MAKGDRPACPICAQLPASELVELNAMLADPSEWPRSVFADWELPKGTLPARMRKWGGVRYGIELLAERGMTVTENQMNVHFRSHVPHYAPNKADVEEVARMVMSEQTREVRDEDALVPAMRPRMFVDYYSTGIQLGLYALEELRRRIEKMTADGERVPDKMLWQLADMGAKLSISHAGLIARRAQGQESDDEIAGFRSGSAPLPSESMNGHRIRVINGMARPVADRGRADRERHNAKAAQDGSPRIGGR